MFYFTVYRVSNELSCLSTAVSFEEGVVSVNHCNVIFKGEGFGKLKNKNLSRRKLKTNIFVEKCKQDLNEQSIQP